MPDPKKPARFPINPTGENFDKLTHDAGPFFQVLGHVGPHNPTGHVGPLVVSAREFGPGVDLQRLATLGVIVEASDEDAETYLSGLPEYAENEPRPVVIDKTPVPVKEPEKATAVEPARPIPPKVLTPPAK